MASKSRRKPYNQRKKLPKLSGVDLGDLSFFFSRSYDFHEIPLRLNISLSNEISIISTQSAAEKSSLSSPDTHVVSEISRTLATLNVFRIPLPTLSASYFYKIKKNFIELIDMMQDYTVFIF